MIYDLTNLKTSHQMNAGGLCSFIFVPKEWLSADVQLNIIRNTVDIAVTLIPGKNWLKADCLPQSTGFDESPSVTPSGVRYNQSIIGVINGDSITNATIMNAMPYYEYVVIYTGHNGEKRIIGHKQKGMNFNAQFSTAKEFAGKHSYQIQFDFESAIRAPFYPF